MTTNEPTDNQILDYAKEDAERVFPKRWYEFSNGAYTSGYFKGYKAALEAATRVPVQGEPNDDREAILRKALEHVREVGESGLAGPYVHDLPKDVDSNWGWLQTMWPVVVAVDIALASRATVPDAATAALDRVQALANLWNDTPDYQPSEYDKGRVDQRQAMTEQLLTALDLGEI